MKRIIIITALLAVACKHYGKKIKEGHIEVYYKDGITERQAQKTAKSIFNLDTDAGANPPRKSFQLGRNGENIILKMVVNQEKAKDMGDEYFSPIALMISKDAFYGKPVDMELTDTRFNTIRSIPYKKPEVSPDEMNTKAFGEKVTAGNAEVYIQGAGKDEALRLAAFLNDYFKPESLFSFQLLKDEAENYIVKMVGNPDKVHTLPVSLFKEVCQGICDKVLFIPSLKFEMTDAQFEPLRTFNYPDDTGDADRQN
jgi:hypothetical protein